MRNGSKKTFIVVRRSVYVKKDAFAILLTILVLITYCSLTVIENVSYNLIGILFLALHVLTIWMVIAILRQPYHTDKTFNEYFYQDKSIKRNFEKDD